MVAPTFDRPEGLRRLLDGLAAQTLPYPRWEAVVVDNGSPPGAWAEVQAVVAKAPFDVRLLRAAGKRGPAVARNAGWRATTAPIVAFIDDDCVPCEGWLEAGLAGFDAPLAGRVGVAQGPTVPAAEAAPRTPFSVVREVRRPSPWFEGCNVWYRRAALEAVGGFDEDLGPMPSPDDTNLGWAVLAAGWDRGWAGQAAVKHEVRERPWSWHVRFHWRDANTVRLAARHPAIRTMFWRPWAIKREGALFAAAAAGLGAAVLGGRRARPALLLGVPYLVWLQPGRRVSATGAALQVAAHAASLAGKARAWPAARTILL